MDDLFSTLHAQLQSLGFVHKEFISLLENESGLKNYQSLFLVDAFFTENTPFQWKWILKSVTAKIRPIQPKLPPSCE